MTTFKQMIEKRTLQQDLTQVNLAQQFIETNEKNRILSNFSIFPIAPSQNQFEIIVGENDYADVYIGNQPIESVASPGGIKSMKKVLFAPKRFSVIFKVSNQLLLSNANIEEFVKRMASNRVAAAIEREALFSGTATGTELTNLQAIVKTAGVPSTLVDFSGADTTSGILNEAGVKVARNSLNKYVAVSDLFWIISPTVQDIISGGGESVLKYKDLPLNSYARLFDKPAYCADLAAGTYANSTSIVLNKNGYGVALSEINVKAISYDTESALGGSVTFVAECYADGKVLDVNAINVTGFNTVTAI